MIDAYVQTKTKEALEATNGDKKDAQKLMITWAVRDQSLLLGLTKPHLKAIVSAQIDHAARPQKYEPDEHHDVRFSKSDADKMLATHMTTNKRSHKVPPPKSSQRQASVMHQLAAAFKKKKS